MKVLFIAQSFDEGVPRNIRLREMFAFPGPMEIEVLCFNGRHPRIHMNAIRIHRMNLTWFASLFLQREFSGRGSGNIFVRKLTGAVNQLYKFFNPIENWRWEQNRIIDFIKGGEFPLVVLMVSPFSNFILADALRVSGYSGKIVLDVGDPLYKNAAIPGSENLIFQKIERQGLAASDALVVTNLATLNFYRTIFEYPHGVEIIPNGFKPLEESIKKEIQFDFRDISAIYAGAVYPELRPVEPLLDALQSINDERVNLRLYSSSVKVPLCSNIFYSERISSDELMKRYEEANLLVYIDNNYGIQSSSKIYELLSLQKPILFLYTYESENYRYCSQFPWVEFVLNETNAIRTKMQAMLDKSGNISTVNFEKLAEYSWQNTAGHYFDFLSKIQ